MAEGQVSPGGADAVKATFLALPTEIRYEIYRLLLIGPAGAISLQCWANDVLKVEPKPRIHTPLLRTSHQIYREASVILYGENRFQYFYAQDDRMGLTQYYFPVGFPSQLIQDLDITFYVSHGGFSVREIWRFLKNLAALHASFKSLTIRYDLSATNYIETDLLQLRSPASAELAGTTSAVKVRKELEMIFWYKEPEASVAALWIKHVEEIAKEKDWIATPTESNRASQNTQGYGGYHSDMVSYLLRPKSAGY